MAKLFSISFDSMNKRSDAVGGLVMGFKKTKYVSKKRLQFESTMSETTIYQFSGPGVLGFNHSDSILCFPIVLL